MTLGTISLRSVQGLPAVPGLKKVTADASGFVALTPEGMAGTSQGGDCLSMRLQGLKRELIRGYLEGR